MALKLALLGRYQSISVAHLSSVKSQYLDGLVLSPTSYQSVGIFRFGSSSRSKRPPLVFTDIKNEDMARALVLQLKPEGRMLVMSEIQKLDSANTQGKSNNNKIKFETGQLKNLCLFNALPFIGFGFLDNFIMIVAGEYIDVTLGATLAITTMTAAALGNLVSDVAGIGLSGYVEVLVGKIGVTIPHLSPAQATTWQARWTQTMGRVFGITIGCILGMFPLLLYNNDEERHKESTKEK